MIALAYLPRYSEIREYYGVPDADNDRQFDQAWWDACTEVFRLPFTLTASWDAKKRIHYLRLHRLIGMAYLDALEAVLRRIGATELAHRGWNVLGDALNLRAMKSSPDLSTHAYGISVDHNNHIAGWLAKPCTQPKVFVEEFEARGFVWGGRFPRKYWDPMHFQACGM